MNHEPLLETASRLLTTAWGQPVRLTLDEAIVEDPGYRNRLLRCRVLAAEGVPQSVVLKTPNEERTIARDLAALRFLSTLPDAAPFVPAYHAGDRDANLLVMEDLGRGPRLRELLRGTDPRAAEEALLSLMERLGVIHGAAVGQEETYRALLAASGPQAPIAHSALRLARDTQQFGDYCRSAGVEPAPRLDEEAAQVVAQITDGPFRTFTSGDIAPVNVICRRGTVQLVDFEVSEYRSALVDGCVPQLRLLASTDANLLPPVLARRLATTYRVSLARHLPLADDDALFSRALVAACVAWTASTLRHLPKTLERDRKIGLSTRRQRMLALLDAFRQASEAHELPFPLFHESAARLRRHLETLWSAETPPMPLFQAFRDSGGSAG